jgi:hypothetical protein
LKERARPACPSATKTTGAARASGNLPNDRGLSAVFKETGTTANPASRRYD